MAENVVRQRLAAILAADVAGYSRLMGDDERATIDAIDQCRAVFREQIEANGGRVVDMAGDSVLAIFDTAIGAFTTAMAAQERLAELNSDIPEDRRMAWRIGVNLGDIHEQDDGTVYGDGVNVAARLEALAEPGGICISDKVHTEVRGKIDRAFADLGEHEVKNIAEPVRAYRVLAEGETAPSRRPVRSRRLVFAGLGFAVILVGAVLWQLRAPAPETPPPTEVATAEPEDPTLALPSGPSIAVLPFDNLSGDPEQDYFADGLTEDIITALSKFPELFVIARNSTFQYKGLAVDVREVGRDLGVQYVLEGSLRKTGDKIRVSAKLLDAGDGSDLWAETYDRDLTAADVFAIQDEVRAHVVATLADLHGIIPRAGLLAAKRKNPESLSAYECYLRAWIVYDKLFTPDEHLTVRDCLERAVEADPNYADAWATLAWIYTDEDSWGYNPRPDPLDRALEAAERAVELDPASQLAHWMLARTHWYRHELDAYFVGAERALAMNPNNSTILALAGIYSAYAGEWERGVAMVRKAAALNPHHPGWYYFAFSFDNYRKGDYAAALAEAQRLNMPGFYLSQIALAAVYGQLANEAGSRQAVEKLLQLYPGFTLESAQAEYRKLNFAPDLIEHMVEGLRKAGVPEAASAPTRPVIAVLPFDSMSEDPAHQFFADGIVEDIITRLARFPDIGVIARNSSFQYKGEAVDVRAVAEELGATYVLEGSVRRSENDIRVIAQLLDASDGTHLWAETYDRDLSAGSVFAIQDEITERVVGAIASGDSIISLAVISASEGKAPADLASYECVLQAYEYWRVITPDVHLNVRTCLEHVVANEPEYAEALALLSGIALEEFRYGYNPRPDMAPPLDRAFRYAQEAIEIDPTSAEAHLALASAAFHRHDMGVFRIEADRIVELSPNDALRLASVGILVAYSGDWEKGMSLMAKAIELNPHHQTWYHFAFFYDAYRQGLDDEALAAAQKLNIPEFFWAHQVLAAAYAQLGMMDKATDAIAALLELYPGYTITDMIGMHRTYNHGDDVIDRMTDGLRKAGLPEGTN